MTENEVRLPGTGKPIATLGKHAVLVRTKLSESEVAILSEEFGAKKFEEQAWVEMDLIIEPAGVGAKGKLRGKEEEDQEQEEGAEDTEGREGATPGGGRDMSV